MVPTGQCRFGPNTNHLGLKLSKMDLPSTDFESGRSSCCVRLGNITCYMLLSFCFMSSRLHCEVIVHRAFNTHPANQLELIGSVDGTPGRRTMWKYRASNHLNNLHVNTKVYCHLLPKCPKLMLIQKHDFWDTSLMLPGAEKSLDLKLELIFG